ncbi:MAG TPA: hypothetical protein VEX35_15520 [Allosphingosinicella sp.]|nr:hypothetical protein [Allosphingosinicella sp.]
MGTLEQVLRFIGAILVASLAAGPLMWFAMVLMNIPTVPGVGWEILSVAIQTIPLGALFAFLPNLIGATVMTGLGALFRPARSPFAWIGAGALGGLLVAAIFNAAALDDKSMFVAMILTGMACAAICRAFTRWPEEAGHAQA